MSYCCLESQSFDDQFSGKHVRKKCNLFSRGIILTHAPIRWKPHQYRTSSHWSLWWHTEAPGISGVTAFLHKLTADMKVKMLLGTLTCRKHNLGSCSREQLCIFWSNRLIKVQAYYLKFHSWMFSICPDFQNPYFMRFTRCYFAVFKSMQIQWWV